MKALLAFVTILAVGALLAGAANATFAPLERAPAALASTDTTIDSGPSGATLESNYFRAPPQPYAAGRLFPCRVQLRMFDKTRLAQVCN